MKVSNFGNCFQGIPCSKKISFQPFLVSCWCFFWADSAEKLGTTDSQSSKDTSDGQCVVVLESKFENVSQKAGEEEKWLL
jgi:hypothetical protein